MPRNHLRETCSPEDLSWSAICGRRLARHGLTEPVPSGRLTEQVGAICGAHAQVIAAAEVSIGLRVEGITRSDVQHALWVDRSLVKTYGQRGTVHLLPSNDLAIWSAALTAASKPMAASSARSLMTAEQTEVVIAAIADALASDPLTFDELSDAVIARAGDWAGDRVMPAFNGAWPRWRQAMIAAAHRGVLCFGPNRGRNVTYTSPAHWLSGFAPAETQTALAEIVRRYLVAYGPATPQQFAQWFGAARPWAAELFETLAEHLRPVAVNGATAWMLAEDRDDSDEPPAGVCLLPYFDAYAVGCHPRDLLYRGTAYERALSRGQAGTVPVLLIDGVVSGIWHQRRSGRKLALTVEPFETLTTAQRRELGEQVDRIGAIMEATPTLTIGPVTAGKHL